MSVDRKLYIKEWKARNAEKLRQESRERYAKDMLENPERLRAYNRKSYRKHRTARLAVDHSHLTGKVRGLLCGRCNSMLGFARDNVEVLRSGIDYLGKYV